MTAEETQIPRSHSRRLETLLTIVAIELLAVVLLLLLSDSGIVLQCSLPVAAGVMLWNWRRLRKAWRRFATAVRSLALSLTSRGLDRRTYRFSLRTLLLVILIAALISAWFAYRYRTINSEKQLLSGRWMLVDPNGNPVLRPDSNPFILDFNEVSYHIDPFHDPKWIDIYEGNMLFRAIYRVDGDELITMDLNPYTERPTSFDQKWYGKTIYPSHYRRLRD